MYFEKLKQCFKSQQKGLQVPEPGRVPAVEKHCFTLLANRHFHIFVEIFYYLVKSAAFNTKAKILSPGFNYEDKTGVIKRNFYLKNIFLADLLLFMCTIT